MSLRREVTPEPGTPNLIIPTSGLPEPGASSAFADQLSNIDHLLTEHRTPSSPDGDDVPMLYSRESLLADFNPGQPRGRNPSPEPHDMPLPSPPSQRLQSPPSRVRGSERFSDPATEPSPSERTLGSRIPRDYGSSGSSTRGHDLPEATRPMRSESTRHRSSRSSPYDPCISTTRYGQSSEPARLTLSRRPRLHGTSSSSNPTSQPDRVPYVSDDFPLRLAPINVLSSAPIPPLTSGTILSNIPPPNPIPPSVSRQLQLTKVYALAVREGDILKYGNRLNDGCTVTACYPTGGVVEEEAPPVRLNGTVRIEWFDPMLRLNRFQLFGGLEHLEVLRVVDDEFK